MLLVSRRFAWLVLVPLACIADLGFVSTQIVRTTPVPVRTPIEMIVVFALVSIALLAFAIPLAIRKLAHRPRAAYLVAWCISVGVATYGLVATTLTADARWYPPFAAAGLMGLVLSRPRVAHARSS